MVVQSAKQNKSSILGGESVASISGGQIRTKVCVLVLAAEGLRLGEDPRCLQNLLRSQGLGQFHVFSKHVEEITEISSIPQLDGCEGSLVFEVNASLLSGFPKSAFMIGLQLLATPLGERPFASCSLDQEQFAFFVNADDANDVLCVFSER